MATEPPDAVARAEGEWADRAAEVGAWADGAGWEDPRAVEAWADLVAAEDRAGVADRAGLDLAESLRSMGRWKTDHPAKEARHRRAKTRLRAALPVKGDEDRAHRASPRLLSL